MRALPKRLRACTAIADIGELWYLYDANGNVTEARQGGHSESSSTDGQVVAQGDVRWTSEGFGLDRGGQGGQAEKKVWARYYSWDEENRLKQSVEGELSVEYRYGADGQRALKYSKRGENLYFDAMWSESINGASIRQSKHVYVGQTRVSTRLNYKGHPDTGFEQANTYYYHGDHLGSAQLVTDPDGQEYEHIEYTPYGELWVEKTRDGIDAIPFRFTGKELDAETGLYYYGARYLDPKTSVWLSADPALGEYVPGAPTDEEARKRNGNLPGMGGVFNTVNLHLYHYAGNNPIKYTDPTGMVPVEGAFSRSKTEESIQMREASKAMISQGNYMKIISALSQNLDKEYKAGYLCDEFIIESLKQGGADSDILFGTASLTADEHLKKLGESTWLQDNPDQGLNIVLVNFGNDKTYDHVEMIDVHPDGKVTLYSHGGSPNDHDPISYSSVSDFEDHAWGGEQRKYVPLGVEE